MKNLNAGAIITVMLVGTLCAFLLMTEIGILYRSTAGDVDKSRETVQHTVDALTGVVSTIIGVKLAMVQRKDKPEEGP